MYIGDLYLLILNLLLIGLWVQILRIPYLLLFPLILVFTFIGTYSLNNNSTEILIMVLFGVIGYVMRKLRYDGAPFLLALILGPLLETAFRQSLIIGSPAIFFQRPISAGLLVLALLLLVVGPLLQWRKKGLALGGA